MSNIESARYVYETLNESDSRVIDRFYVGHETCEKMIPNKNVIKKISLMEKPISLLTPPLTDSFFQKWVDIIVEFKNFIDEIIINDVGLLYKLRNSSFTKSVGRLLSKQKRDPRYYTTPETMRSPINFTQDYYKTFCKVFGISRVEIDPLPWESLPGHLKYSLHFPFTYLSTSRSCYERFLFGKENQKACRKQCLKSVRSIKNPNFPRLVIKGNAIFYINKKKIIVSDPIDRIVFNS